MTRKLLWILGLALLVRLVGIDHGLPFRYVPDTHMIRGALGMAKERNLAPPPNRYTSYPYLMPYLLLPEYAGWYAVGRLTGEYADSDDFGRQVIADPTPLVRITRLVITLFGLLAVYLTYRIAARVTDRRTALVAAYLVATSLLLVHLGKSARPWVPLTALVLLTADRSLVYVRRPSLKRALWMGGAAGLAAACHQAGALAVLLPLTALAVRLPEEPIPELFRSVGLAIGFALTTLFVGYPYLLFGDRVDVGVDGAEREAAFHLGGQTLAFDRFSFERLPEVALSLFGAEPALFILAAIGLGCVGWRGGKRPQLRPVLFVYPFVGLALFLGYEGTHTRYLTPVVPFFALFAAFGVRRLRQSRIGLAFSALLLAVPLIQVVRLDLVMSRPDTRTLFLERVAQEVPADSVIAVERYGPPLRWSKEGMEWVLEEGRWLSRRERLEGTEAIPNDPHRPPYRVIPLGRFYDSGSLWPWQWIARESGAEAAVEKPLERFLDETGATWLLRVERAPGRPETSALVELLARRGEWVAALGPSDRSAPPREALLPTDPEFALTALWMVDRPGPSLSLWRIRPGEIR